MAAERDARLRELAYGVDAAFKAHRYHDGYEEVHRITGTKGRPQVHGPLLAGDGHTELHDLGAKVERLAEYFGGVFGAPAPVDLADLNPGPLPIPAGEAAAAVADGEFTAEEITAAVGCLKNYKAAGNDGVHAELLKCGGSAMILWLQRLFNLAYHGGAVPHQWREALLVPLEKPGAGDRRQCSNLRGISLLSVPGKAYTMVLLNRVKQALHPEQLTEHQSGSRPCRSYMR